MSKLRTYKQLKEDLVCEFYLNEIRTSLYRKVMSQFRVGFLNYEQIRVDTKIYLMKKEFVWCVMVQ